MRLGTFGYFVDFFASLACVAALLWIEMSGARTWLSASEWLMSLLMGLCLWTLIEYAIHRWLYHGVSFFIPLHDAHHREPNACIGAAPFVGIVLIFAIIYWPAHSVHSTLASGLTAGLLLGYMAYQVVHHATHFWRLTPGRYLYRARLHHFGHHHRDVVGNFGIVTMFWDQVFGTLIERKQPLALQETEAH